MKRLAYLIPRLIILGLVVLLIWVGKDPIARYLIVHNLENATGAEVEVGQIRVSLRNQKVYIKEFTMSDPRNPMKNLIQADMAYFSLQPRELLNRQFIIDYGQMSEVVFGAPRTQPASDQLVSSIPDPDEVWQPKVF
ncbi:MAG: hypothetical protein AAF623_14995, partial [Planctomycetota bacterium]